MIPDAIHDDLPRLPMPGSARAWDDACRAALEPALNGIAVVGAIRLLLRSPAVSAPDR